MSDTHRATPRYQVGVSPAPLPGAFPRYYLYDTERDDIVRGGMTRTAALAAASRLNGFDMTPIQDRRENR